ncbi:hypothetical protein PC9H_005860 [Pleurotus ostreatus]|uniref:Uncharacterized protein n=1 Tax=Pleurotus ostreatus TaxID=5322 RepID=A0A8H6ZV75_PLEOS|nr:uncharacterized protein PC9H_005860 [Pleurotus ostreatus]KAF7430160.1 hypothetical protein PC9H_005860 [Pleurotus ostreatus]
MYMTDLASPSRRVQPASGRWTDYSEWEWRRRRVSEWEWGEGRLQLATIPSAVDVHLPRVVLLGADFYCRSKVRNNTRKISARISGGMSFCLFSKADAPSPIGIHQIIHTSQQDPGLSTPQVDLEAPTHRLHVPQTPCALPPSTPSSRLWDTQQSCGRRKASSLLLPHCCSRDVRNYLEHDLGRRALGHTHRGEDALRVEEWPQRDALNGIINPELKTPGLLA